MQKGGETMNGWNQELEFWKAAFPPGEAGMSAFGASSGGTAAEVFK